MNNWIQKTEEALYEFLRNNYPGLFPLDASGSDLLAMAAKKLSDHFTHSRGSRPADYLSDPSNRASYIAHFTLTNAAKVFHCFEQLPTVSDASPLKILDIGSGAGASPLAATNFFRGAPLEIQALDKNGAILKDAASIFELCRREKDLLDTRRVEINSRTLNREVGAEKFNIVTIVNFFNELEDKEEPFRICSTLIEGCLNENGYLIIIDPALKETTRPLMHLRDRLLDECDIHVHAPCIHQKPCPMLQSNDRDWCHFYIEWNRPRLIEEMDELVGTDHTYLKMGYLILKKGSAASVQKGASRVVSSPLISKGKKELMLCNESGELIKMRRLDRNRSELNSYFDAVKRGDLIGCNCSDNLEKNSPFKMIRRWN
ncbi:MAG: hypothetical protein HN337_09225 [Deltaproteobacteria bacterium]|jgi:ribosomal protein RSM22 (predicted rRNA methylase)|nr:hypothetical protein [Deltaproteobacteria bacterium]